MKKPKCFYAKWESSGYVVRSAWQGDFRVASFVTEREAEDYADYRNCMLLAFDDSGTRKYKKFRTLKRIKEFNQ